VTNVLMNADGITITWDPVVGAPAGTVYDIVRGRVAELPVGSGANETCVQAGTPAPPAVDTTPAGTSALWYLIRGRHVCGTGTYGTRMTNGAPGAVRISGVCP
jgi:hypothetical protein